MKIRLTLVTALFLAVASIGSIPSEAKIEDPDAIIKKLYAEQKKGTGPFFQTKSRAIVDRYFRKDLADLIWRDAVNSKGEVGAINFDPLYNAQDIEIKDFVIMKTGWGGDTKFGGDDQAVVQVTFKNFGKEEMVSFQFARDKAKKWKIYDIKYSDGSRLMDNFSTEQEGTQTEDATASGELQVGKTQSVILYVGAETGDYAAYCFTNSSKAGVAILKSCKNGNQCEVTGKIDYSAACKVPGLEADLSASGKITMVKTVKKGSATKKS